MTNLFIAIGIPLLGVLFFVVRMLYGYEIGRNWKSVMWTVWSVNWVSLIAIASWTGREFNQGAHLDNPLTLNINSDTLRLELDKRDDYGEAIFQMGHLRIGDDQLVSSDVHLDIEQSEGEVFELVQRNYSRGRQISDATLMAGAIDYQPTIEPGLLSIPHYFTIPAGEKWRAQEIRLVLKVPDGKSIKLGPKISRKLHHFPINRSIEHPWPRGNHIWSMEKGGLVCHDYVLKKNRKQEFPHQDFSKLIIEGKMKVVVTQGEQYQVRLTGKEVYTDKVEMVKMGETLTVFADLRRTNSPVRLFITMPRLLAIDAEDTDDVKIQGFTEPLMHIKNEGKQDFKAYVNVDSLIIRQTGRNELDIRGSGQFMKVSLDGRASIDAEHFSVKRAYLQAMDRTSAKLSVSDQLTKRIDQEDHVKLILEGEPAIVEEMAQQKEDS
ncbi:MAG: DUF2807 domain-containing protein [Bacteroidota bacterium]